MKLDNRTIRSEVGEIFSVTRIPEKYPSPAVPIGDWDVSEVTNMDWLFMDKEKFNEDISRWNVSKVKSAKNMFLNCLSFNQDLGKWDVSSLENMENMFFMTIVAIPQEPAFEGKGLKNWDVENVKIMRYAFSGCVNFVEDIGHWNVSNCLNFEYTFASCFKLDISLESWDFTKALERKETRFEKYESKKWKEGSIPMTRNVLKKNERGEEEMVEEKYDQPITREKFVKRSYSSVKQLGDTRWFSSNSLVKKSNPSENSVYSKLTLLKEEDVDEETNARLFKERTERMKRLEKKKLGL